MNFLKSIANYFDLNKKTYLERQREKEASIEDLVSVLLYTKKEGDKVFVKEDGEEIELTE